MKKEHKRLLEIKTSNTTIPSSFLSSASIPVQECNMAYAAPPNVHDARICGREAKQPLQTVASLQDQKSLAEAFVVSFLAEHTLPFTMAPQVIRLVQELARDHKMLQSLSMDRTTTPCKLREELGEMIHEKIVWVLQQVFFSMNVDECMLNAYEKIFSIIVSYFSDKLKRVVVHYYRFKL